MKIRIADILFEFLGISPENMPPNTLQFRVEDDRPADIRYTFHVVGQLPRPDSSWELCYQREAIKVYGKAGLEQRLLFDPTSKILYGVYREDEDGSISVFFHESFLKELKIDTIFNSLLSLERHFAKRGCYILHCAFLAYKGQAILFSGPSGIGKSTHANLWCENIGDTHVVNGDRCLISRQDNGTYVANGWPVCGSSGICHVEHYPIQSIVFMGQSRENQVWELTLMEKLRQLNMQVTINHWNTQATQNAMDWMLELASNIHILYYTCNMEPDAPEFLREKLLQ